jgi:hypothetical protein
VPSVLLNHVVSYIFYHSSQLSVEAFYQACQHFITSNVMRNHLSPISYIGGYQAAHGRKCGEKKQHMVSAIIYPGTAVRRGQRRTAGHGRTADNRRSSQ